MQKYQFTGHLSPLPPGVKLPLQISGDVYLAREVEDCIVLKDAIIAELKASVATLNRSNLRLRRKIDRLSS
jgi:hypothetical protein